MIKQSIPDIIIALVAMVLAVLGLVATRDLPTATLEPIGPAAFPFWASIILFCLGATVLARALLVTSPSKEDSDTALTQRSVLAIWAGFLTLLYIGVMNLELLGFRWATVIYAFVLTIALFGFRPKYLPTAAVIAAVLGIGLHYLFTRLFFIDLP